MSMSLRLSVALLAATLSFSPLAAAVPIMEGAPVEAPAAEQSVPTSPATTSQSAETRASKLPEPEAWALMVVGLFAVGRTLRHRATDRSFV